MITTLVKATTIHRIIITIIIIANPIKQVQNTTTQITTRETMEEVLETIAMFHPHRWKMICIIIILLPNAHLLTMIIGHLIRIGTKAIYWSIRVHQIQHLDVKQARLQWVSLIKGMIGVIIYHRLRVLIIMEIYKVGTSRSHIKIIIQIIMKSKKCIISS